MARTACSMRNTLVITSKITANVMMAMLFITVMLTIFSSCSEEKINFHATLAKGVGIEVDSVMTMGHTEVSLEANAVDAASDTITGMVELSYTGLPEVPVPQLGLPTTLTTTDGVHFTSSDGNYFTRNFAVKSNTNSVSAYSVGSPMRVLIIARLNDTTELVEAQFEEKWRVNITGLPEDISSVKDGTETVRVLYKRVVKPTGNDTPTPGGNDTPTPGGDTPQTITYRIRAEFDGVVDGDAYYNVIAEELTNGVVTDSWSHYLAGISFGNYNPNIPAQGVTSTEFTTLDWSEAMDTEAPLYQVGTGRYFDVINHAKTQYHMEVKFPCRADDSGNTTKAIPGHVVVWSYTCIFHNPKTGEDMPFVFDGKLTTTVNHVVFEEDYYQYVRTVQITCNDQMVDTQTGRVILVVQQP